MKASTCGWVLACTCLAVARASFGAPGDLIGPEFQVNVYTIGFQYAPSIAVSSDGSSLIVWPSFGQDGQGQGAFGHRYDSSGMPAGSEFQVNTVTAGSQYFPRAAALDSGEFVVVWYNEITAGDYNVIGQKYSSTGQPIGGEFLVNTYTTYGQTDNDVAAAPGGGFVVAWDSRYQDGSGKGIFGRRFDSLGQPLGGEFPVNAYTLGSQLLPRIADLTGGGFAVAWMSYQDGDDWGVFGRSFDSAGQPTGGDFQVNTFTPGPQRDHQIAGTADGGFVVVWTGGAQRFDANGQKLGTEFLPRTYPDVAADGDGFTIAYQCADDGSFSVGICATRFDGGGQPIGAEFQVNTYTSEDQRSPQISSAGNRIVVAWETDRDFEDEIAAQHLEAGVTSTPTDAPGTQTPTATPTAAASGCAPSPQVVCFASGRTSVKIRNTGDAVRNQFLWKWTNGTAAKSHFGNPVTMGTFYDLCVYDDGALVMSAQVTADGNWAENTRGFKYKDKTTPNPSGINKVFLKEGAGNAKILVKGRGAALAPPVLPLGQTTNVVVQFVRDGGAICWQGEFVPAATKNDGVQFKDKEP